VKRIVAIVLPDIACELARLSSITNGPFAVIVDDDEPSDEPVRPSAILHAVDRQAWQYGARPGQKAAQAAAFVGKLNIVRLSRSRILGALGTIAEVALSFGTTAGLDLHGDDERLRDEEALARYPAGPGAGPYDTVWLDVTGCSRLVGGDDLLCAELRDRIGQLGHRARVAIADGPRIAQALARWSPSSETVVPAGESAEHLAPLPVAALPLSPERLGWLGKLGILRVADLALLDEKRLTPRLASGRKSREAADLISLLSGRDDVPVVPYERPRCIVELASFDHELDGIEPLFFVLRGLTGRAVARLRARGEGRSLASITLTLDRSILELTSVGNAQSRAGDEVDDELLLELELPVPLASERDLLRALHAKLERLTLIAPIRAVRLTLDGLAPQRHHQLAMHEKQRDPNALPTLLAELSAWLGSERVGFLERVDAHRPEARSKLAPCAVSAGAISTGSVSVGSVSVSEPTRLLPEPIEITRTDGVGGRAASQVRPGSLVAAEHHLFILDRTRLDHRIDAVEWWSAQPLRRDYLRAWLHGSSGTSDPQRPASRHTEHVEASLFVTRDADALNPRRDVAERGPRVFLHGWFD
jgi:protein ImuB